MLGTNEAPIWVEGGLHALAEGLVGLGLCEYPPTGNYAQDYENHLFAIRGYCWCDGDGPHADGCPPNFEMPSRDIQVDWYKWCGRDTTWNRRVSAIEWHEAMLECLRSIEESV